MAENERVLILGCTHAGTAIARSLGKRGIYTIGLTYNPNQFGLASRYLDEWHLCPHPEDGEAFIDFLLENKAKWGGSVLIETNDYFAAALSKHKARLLPHYKVVSADWEHVKLFLKKDMTYALADVCDVPHPQIYEPTTLVEFDAMADRFVFPLMIKPVLSHEFTKLFHTKLFINDTLDLLRANFQGCLEAHQAVMISEIIPGTDYGTVERIHVYINSKGEVSAEFFTVKLRQTPPMYGVMRVGKSVPPIDDLREYSLRILSHLHYRGYANFEFKRDPRDGQLKLLEVNVRLPRQLALDIASGVDFPWMIYQDMMKDHQEVCTTYQEDTYVIELIADVADFIRFDPDHNLQRFFQPYLARRKVFSYLSLSDPGPFIRQIKIRSQRGIRRLLHLRTHRELRDGTNNE